MMSIRKISMRFFLCAFTYIYVVRAQKHGSYDKIFFVAGLVLVPDINTTVEKGLNNNISCFSNKM